MMLEEDPSADSRPGLMNPFLAIGSVVAATAYYYYTTRPTPEEPLVPLDMQSPLLTGPERIHVSKVFAEKRAGTDSGTLNSPHHIPAASPLLEHHNHQKQQQHQQQQSSPQSKTASQETVGLVTSNGRGHVNQEQQQQQQQQMGDDAFLNYFYEDAQTLYETFRKGVATSEHNRCLGWRPGPTSAYQWLTYRETLTKITHLAAGLKALGLAKHALVGVYAQNCPEWVIFEHAAYCHSFVVVPLYDTLGADSCQFIVRQTEMSLVVAENDEKVNTLLEQCLGGFVRHIVVIRADSIQVATVDKARGLGIELHALLDVEALGRDNPAEEELPRPDDLATICYTSGTTGNPKGVMLTHRNVVASCCSVLLQLGVHSPRASDTMISFLPLAHMLERCCENAVYHVGGCVGFYSGDIKRLNDDLQMLRPTIMPAVPRLLNRVYDKIHGEVAKSAPKKFLFDTAFNSKRRDLGRGIVRRNTMWDRIVFKKVQDAFGGNLRLIVVGSAPLAGNVLTFMRAALGCMISEGYGQTEATAPITLTVSGDFAPEHVGPPVACNAVKLVDVPEMDYLARNNQGEVCVRGSNVFQGYFREPELTASVMDADGWLHTGDIGEWLPNGTLRIIDRRKHIFKLSQGEYIVPEKIESIYARSLFVEQVFVYGESLKSSVIGVVVPDQDVLMRWAKQNGRSEDFATLCRDASVKAMLFGDMMVKGKEGGLKSFEQVKDVYVHWDLFSVKNGLLTPTFKSKRNEIQKTFKVQLTEMYEHLD